MKRIILSKYLLVGMVFILSMTFIALMLVKLLFSSSIKSQVNVIESPLVAQSSQEMGRLVQVASHSSNSKRYYQFQKNQNVPFKHFTDLANFNNRNSTNENKDLASDMIDDYANSADIENDNQWDQEQAQLEQSLLSELESDESTEFYEELPVIESGFQVQEVESDREVLFPESNNKNRLLNVSDLEAHEKWLKSLSGDYYGIQVISSSNLSKLLKYLNSFTHLRSQFIIVQVSHPKYYPWYSVLCGVYTSAEEAHRMKKSLSQVFSGSKNLWVRSVSDIKKHLNGS